MKKLLYIGRPNLGENMFATPVFDFLSKEYEITLLIPKHTAKAFCDYPFIKRILAGCNHGDTKAKLPTATLQVIFDIFNGNEETFYTHHHDDDTNFLINHPELAYIKKLNVLHDKEIKLENGENFGGKYFISRTKKYMLKMQLMTLEETMNYDCAVRTPPHNKNQKTNDILIYQGSRESLRKLPIQTIMKFVEQCPTAMYIVPKETADTLDFKGRNIKHIITDPFTDENINTVISAFRSEPKVLIGPDSGLTQLACAYRIPLIWLQSRISFENVIDIYHKSHSTIYMKKEPDCKKDCLGCASIESLKNNKLSYGLYIVTEKRTGHQQLECFINKRPSCLEYTDSEISEILNLIKP
jgi:hypothetical protein